MNHVNNDSCVFCKIVREEIHAPVIAENEYAVAFPDRSPQAPVHFLIVPKKHIENINDVSGDDREYVWHMIELAREVAKQHGADGDNGFNLISNNGKSAGQVVFHMHWHFMVGKRTA